MQIIDKWKWYELIDDQMQIMINEIFNIFKKCFFFKNHVITLLKMKRDEWWFKKLHYVFLCFCHCFSCIRSSNVASRCHLCTRMFVKDQSFNVYLKGEFQTICLNEKTFLQGCTICFWKMLKALISSCLSFYNINIRQKVLGFFISKCVTNLVKC